LKKVQFKLHETYTNSLRTVESPPFEVTETGWGEFEVVIKLYFVPEASEKPQNLWHALKLHPYGPDAEAQRERKDAIVSQNYEEIIFNEPTEPFYEIMTSGPPPLTPAPPTSGSAGRGKSGKGAKQQLQAAAAALKRGGGDRSAEIPFADSPDNPYSQKAEGAELDRLQVAIKTVEGMLRDEQAKLAEKEKTLAELRKRCEGVVVPPKGKK
jgi:YEATS domain-containing protein 4